jgi:hypothetical protein
MKAMPIIKEGAAIFALDEENNIIAGVCFGYNENIRTETRLYKLAYGNVTSEYPLELDFPEEDVFRYLNQAVAERERRIEYSETVRN